MAALWWLLAAALSGVPINLLVAIDKEGRLWASPGMRLQRA